MRNYRKSSRTYSNKKIYFKQINKIINKAINYAPSSCNHQMWHFVAVDNIDLKNKIFEISKQSHFKEAAWVIFISTHYGWNHNKFSVIQSAAAATQMILFFADQEGLVGCWNAGIGNTNKIKKLLKIDRSFGVIGALTIGFPGDKSNFEIKASKRKIKNVLSRNIFNRPENSIYPLKDYREPCYWKAMNNSNIYAEHNPNKWSFSQIGNFRSYSVYAKSPFPNTYFSKRFKLELEIELFGNKIIEKILNSKSGLNILEILPYGGQYTNLLARNSNLNINIAEYSENNFRYIQSRITSQKLKKIKYIEINDQGKIVNNKKIYDVIYCLQSIEEYPNPKILILEIKKICKRNEYIVFSFRNLFSWYGIKFYFINIKNQVPNFGPHVPINPFLVLYFLRKNFRIIDIYGISILPDRIGKKNTNPVLKFFSRLLIIVCKNQKIE